MAATPNSIRSALIGTLPELAAAEERLELLMEWQSFAADAFWAGDRRASLSRFLAHLSNDDIRKGLDHARSLARFAAYAAARGLTGGPWGWIDRSGIEALGQLLPGPGEHWLAGDGVEGDDEVGAGPANTGGPVHGVGADGVAGEPGGELGPDAHRGDQFVSPNHDLFRRLVAHKIPHRVAPPLREDTKTVFTLIKDGPHGARHLGARILNGGVLALTVSAGRKVTIHLDRADLAFLVAALSAIGDAAVEPAPPPASETEAA